MCQAVFVSLWPSIYERPEVWAFTDDWGEEDGAGSESTDY